LEGRKFEASDDEKRFGKIDQEYSIGQEDEDIADGSILLLDDCDPQRSCNISLSAQSLVQHLDHAQDRSPNCLLHPHGLDSLLVDNTRLQV
jgi:hypothetical protein